MAQSTKSTLKGYFNAGDEPTETQFAELIDSNLNLADTSATQAVTGSVNFTGDTAVRKTSAVVNGDANLTLTELLHSGRTVMQTDVSADRTYTIPAPSAAGITYHFVGQGTGAAADGHDIILRPTDDTEFFDGAITWMNTIANDNSDDAVDNQFINPVWANGTNHDQLQINVPASYDIHICAASTTVWYIWGTVTGATAPAFSNA
tara:strand:+ start:196 stop:810 length:615 start_codon:yes stop_codon:yes gene_type:complete